MKEVILNHPMIKHKIAILRNEKTGTKEFRELVSEIAMLLCYEALKDAKTTKVDVQTPIAKTKCEKDLKLLIILKYLSSHFPRIP